MYEKGEEIVLDNGKEYVVIDYFEHNTKKYLFLIGEESRMLNLVEIENDALKKIESDEEYKQVYDLVMERNKEEINKIVE